jgi:signal transduction histidine kinase
VLFAIGIFITGALYYKKYEKLFRTDVEHKLSAIADLKVSQLVQWRKERLDDGNVFYANEDFTELVKRYLKDPNDLVAKKRILAWLKQIYISANYSAIFLSDTSHIKRIIISEKSEGPKAFFSPKSDDSLKLGKIVFEDFYRDETFQKIFLKVLVPIIDKKTNNQLIAKVELRLDPFVYLYPLIKSWPTPSKTSETLIVKREGDSVVFLNELKFQKNTALNLHIPLNRKDILAVKAVLGEKGIVKGLDYKGDEVIGYVCSVPNSPWFMVTRMDKAEVFAPLNEKLWTIIGLIIILLLSTGSGFGFIWRLQSVKTYKEKAEAANKLIITNEKLLLTLENLERSNKELEQFAYVASHDLQEPLRLISSYTQLLERKYKDQLDADAHEYIQFAVEGANRMQKLINDLLDYSRITVRGKEFQKVDTHLVLGMVISNLQHRIIDNSALITNDDLPIIQADESQILCLFQNLIENALKYKKKTEIPIIHISCKKKNNLYEFSVKDNGIGIDMQFQDRIFIIFQRLHSIKDYPGTGIGLSICKRIVERHGGTIWLKSKINEGATFYFTLSA